jgi:hypothetical protein
MALRARHLDIARFLFDSPDKNVENNIPATATHLRRMPAEDDGRRVKFSDDE